MVVPIIDVVKMTLSVADILVEPIIGTPLHFLMQVCYYSIRVLLQTENSPQYLLAMIQLYLQI